MLVETKKRKKKKKEEKRRKKKKKIQRLRESNDKKECGVNGELFCYTGTSAYGCSSLHTPCPPQTHMSLHDRTGRTHGRHFDVVLFRL